MKTVPMRQGMTMQCHASLDVLFWSAPARCEARNVERITASRRRPRWRGLKHADTIVKVVSTG